MPLWKKKLRKLFWFNPNPKSGKRTNKEGNAVGATFSPFHIEWEKKKETHSKIDLKLGKERQKADFAIGVQKSKGFLLQAFLKQL